MSWRKLAEPILNRIGYVRKQTPPREPRIGHYAPEPKRGEAHFKGGKRYYYETGYGLPRYEIATGAAYSVEEMRQLAASHWPSACINHLLNDVYSTDWQILPIDPQKPNKDQLDYIRTWFLNPNQNRESWSHVCQKVARDVLTLDAGVFKHVYAKRKPHGMVQVMAGDGGQFYKEVKAGVLGVLRHNLTWNEYDPLLNKEVPRQADDLYVGYWEHGRGSQTPYEPQEISYVMQHPLTDYEYGLSNTETLKAIILWINHSVESADKYYRGGEIRKALLVPEGDDWKTMSDDDWIAWNEKFDSRVKAAPHNLIPIDTKVALAALNLDRRALQFVETQDEYRKAVLATYHVTPVELGITRDIQKSTEESQREVYVRKGLLPLLKIEEYHTNMEIMTEFFRDDPDHKGHFAGEEPEVYFSFNIYDPIQAMRDLEMDQKMFDLGIPLNRILKARGRQPVPWGDMNPFVIKNFQQFSQSVYYGAISIEQFTQIANLESIAKAKELLKKLGEFPEDIVKISKNIFHNWKKRQSRLRGWSYKDEGKDWVDWIGTFKKRDYAEPEKEKKKKEKNER